MNPSSRHHEEAPSVPNGYIITGPTSGIGRATALELSRLGTVILVGRDPVKLDGIHKIIGEKGGRAVSIPCDLSDVGSVRRAAEEIIALGIPLSCLINNAGIRQPGTATKNAAGWDMTVATNHLGTFALTEALMPHMEDGANVLFVVSAVEDPERGPAVAAGFRGGCYISMEACARGEFLEGGSRVPGFDAYATSKQAMLASAMALARENPRLRINAIEPGVNPTTALGKSAGPGRMLQSILLHVLVRLLMPFIRILSTPERAARVIAGILVDPFRRSGVYFDERGRPMNASERARDPVFQNRVLQETREFLKTHS